MPMRQRSKLVPTQLPPCDGPKLHRFKHHNRRIKWHERLGDDQSDNSSADGYVFRAEINKREYAIKVFKFFDPLDWEHYWGPLLGEDTDLTTAAYYTDPFFAECRAYGRIRDLSEKHKSLARVAVPCHGFFFLGERDEKILTSRDIDLGSSEISPQYQQAAPLQRRARAIVKDLASSETGVGEKTLKKVFNGIAILNRYEIYNMDIRIENYRDARLVDFGSSWTEPHRILDALSAGAAQDSRLTDRVMFDQMVEDERIPNPDEIRAMHSHEFTVARLALSLGR